MERDDTPGAGCFEQCTSGTVRGPACSDQALPEQEVWPDLSRPVRADRQLSAYLDCGGGWTKPQPL